MTILCVDVSCDLDDRSILRLQRRGDLVAPRPRVTVPYPTQRPRHRASRLAAQARGGVFVRARERSSSPARDLLRA
jgi:hypothetical protein